MKKLAVVFFLFAFLTLNGFALEDSAQNVHVTYDSAEKVIKAEISVLSGDAIVGHFGLLYNTEKLVLIASDGSSLPAQIPEKDANGKSYLTYVVEAAKKLGTNIIRLWAGNEGSAAYTGQKKEDFFSECRKIAQFGAQNDVIFCLECHNWTYTDTKETALELMKAVDSPNFRMYWQPNQFKSVEENIAYAKLLSPYTEHIHVFNWKGEQKMPLCEAVDVWKRYLSAFDTDKTLLLEFMPDGNIQSLEKEAAALRQIIGE